MKKILLIEDNPEMRENTSEILELSNYEVITAENGKLGVEKARANNPDLIICDIMMPELDGYGVLFALSKDPNTASIPFIFLTAKAEKSDFRKGMSHGADDYISKPFDDVELLDAIESRLKKSDTVKKRYEQSADGFDTFISDARGMNNLEKLSENRKSRAYKKKSVLFYEGDHPNALLQVVSGKVKTYKTNEDGKEYITGIHGAGDFLGYVALLKDVPYPESAMVLEECEITMIPKEDFFSLIHNNRDVSHSFIKLLTKEVIEQEEKLLKLAYGSVRQRVAEVLLQLDKRYQQGPNERMSITRDDLAKIVGTAKETLIRTLSDFKDERLIEIKDKNITIIDLAKLERLSN
ncbi:response regulator [Flammeovirga yaeyamensis]|uniref:Response regulator n=1 Tax=Flammeovirga yaeyamensis TaxID=367791 RepID=A0AAX1N6L4_9BACT|nr:MULTISPECIES: response regulator [Flammeovirga]ANQ49710.1 response regulator [Flammeovirga sp. MY04]MBB3697425.1 CRP-like cAMP-binding protein [Flammeovirga yaeyamensis]NMF36119.1 response regulator [Flammeovirga yaeyamensis]QWG02852.1 response regulator [Flammeovirga yaeyamensis]